MDMALISLIIFGVLSAVQIAVILMNDIDLKKRRIYLILDFFGVSAIYFVVVIIYVYNYNKYFVPAFIVLFFIIYNIMLFNVVKKMILRNRVSRIMEEINDSIIESLRKLAELDFKNAYQIVDRALERYPDSDELRNLKYFLDNRLRMINERNRVRSRHKKAIDNE